MANEPLRKIITGSVHSLLKPHGYRKNGQLFQAPRQGVVHLVWLQGSRSSTASQFVFTVNLGIWVLALAPVRGGIPDKPDIGAAHWHQRLGHLMPQHDDVWWRVSSEAQAAEAAGTICQALQPYALPLLDTLSSDSQLLEYWRSGQHGGLTALQRIEYLGKLQQRRSAV